MKQYIRTLTNFIILKLVLLYLSIRSIYSIIIFYFNKEYETVNNLWYRVFFLFIFLAFLLGLKKKGIQKSIAPIRYIIIFALFILVFNLCFSLPFVFSGNIIAFLIYLPWLFLIFFMLLKPDGLLAVSQLSTFNNSKLDKKMFYTISLKTILLLHIFFYLESIFINYFFPIKGNEILDQLTSTKSAFPYDTFLGLIFFILLFIFSNRMIRVILKQERKSKDFLIVFVRIFFFWLFCFNLFYLFQYMFNHYSVDYQLMISYIVISLIVIYPKVLTQVYYRLFVKNHEDRENNPKFYLIEDIVCLLSFLFIFFNSLDYLIYWTSNATQCLTILGRQTIFWENNKYAILIYLGISLLVFVYRKRIAQYYCNIFKLPNNKKNKNMNTQIKYINEFDEEITS